MFYILLFYYVCHYHYHYDNENDTFFMTYTYVKCSPTRMSSLPLSLNPKPQTLSLNRMSGDSDPRALSCHGGGRGGGGILSKEVGQCPSLSASSCLFYHLSALPCVGPSATPLKSTEISTFHLQGAPERGRWALRGGGVELFRSTVWQLDLRSQDLA
jgi:hypothetical protein